MCAIMDNNVRHEVFGDSDAQTPAGKYFLEWLEGQNRIHGILVIGGELKRELGEYDRFQAWAKTAILFGRVREISDGSVDNETNDLRAQNICKSNDEHILALARVSDTRLLFTNDQALQDDFGDRNIINNPRGQIYTTAVRHDLQQVHRDRLDPRTIRRICRHCRQKS